MSSDVRSDLIFRVFPSLELSLQCLAFSCGLWFHLTRSVCGWNQFCRNWTLASGSSFGKSKRTMVTMSRCYVSKQFCPPNKSEMYNIWNGTVESFHELDEDASLAILSLPIFQRINVVNLQLVCLFLPFREEDHAGSDWERGHRVGPLFHVSQGWLIISSWSNCCLTGSS